MLRQSILLGLLLLAVAVQGFVPAGQPWAKSPVCRRAATRVRSTPDEASTAAKDEGRSEDLETLRRELELANTRRPLEGVKEAVSKVPLPSMTIDTSKPFRFPAYGFLGIAVLLGISFTGSCVELAGGKPLLGVLPTEAIIALSGPGALGVFFLAVQRFNQEAEEDNERYLKEEERKEAGYDDEDEEE